MKPRILILLACSLLWLAQACAPLAPQNTEPSGRRPDRLLVNDTLRFACRGFLQTDSKILAGITRLENDRLNGIPKSEQLHFNQFICTHNITYPDLVIACMECSTALVNQIYGW